jgi:hypothetical protein
MVSFLMAMRTEHSVALWHPVGAYFSGANTIGGLPEPKKISTSNTAKEIHPVSAADCHNLLSSSERFIAVWARNSHLAHTSAFVWIGLSESNSLNKGCHSHFSYNLKHHLACPPTLHHRFKGCKKCCSCAFIHITSP